MHVTIHHGFGIGDGWFRSHDLFFLIQYNVPGHVHRTTDQIELVIESDSFMTAVEASHAHLTHLVAYGKSSSRALPIDPPQDVHIP